MLDAFGIAFRRLGIKAQADEKAQHDLVPPPAFLASARPVSVRKTDRYFARVISPSRARRSSVLLTVGTFTPSRAAMSTGRASP
jgi:hypothetical protein